MPRTYRHWTEEDTQQLRKLFGTMSCANIAAQMNRSASYLQKKATTLGLFQKRAPLTPKLQTLIAQAGAAGITVDQMAQHAGRSARAIARALASLLADGATHRHRHGNADRYYATAADCAANAQRLKAQRLEKVRQTAQAAYKAKREALGIKPRTPRAATTPATKQKALKPATKKTPRKTEQLLVVLPGTPAPVRTPALRGPAHLPGKPITPPGVVVQKARRMSDSRYEPAPDAYGLGFHKRPPGDHSHLQTRPWVSAMLGGHGS